MSKEQTKSTSDRVATGNGAPGSETAPQRVMLPCVNPATGQTFDQAPVATAEDVARARAELRGASPAWAGKPVKERIRILRKMQAMLVDSADTISETITLDTGKSRQDGLFEVFMIVDRMHHYYRRAPRWLARRAVPRDLFFFRRYYTQPYPFGVAAVIGPWNYPFELTMGPLLVALLAGNAVMVKPSEVAAGTGLLIEKLIQSVPELSPFVRVLHGDGRVGAAMIASRPDVVFLTGSVATGRAVLKAAAEHLIPVLTELGGKDPMIVLEDADLEAAARWGVWGSYYNTGQTCVSIERVYAVEGIYDDLVAACVAEAQRYKVGYSPEKNNPHHLGPLTFERQKTIIQDHLDDALAKGARIVHGGRIEGMFMEPTILVGVDHRMKLMREETFGPIMPIMKVRDEAEAIRLANDSDFGLGASVWSRDLKRAERVAHQLEAGTTNVNDTVVHYAVPLLPFGGVRLSGNARTHGRQDVMQFTRDRSFAVGGSPLPFDLAVRMRSPNNYKLAAGIMRLAFGVKPRQRAQPIAESAAALQQTKIGQVKATTAAGTLVAAAALLFGLWRAKRG